jgi:hypothetical protein
MGDPLPALDSDVRQLKTDLEDLESFTLKVRAELTDDVTDLDEHVAELTKLVARLTDRVDWLERQLRSSGSVTEFDLDDVDSEASALAEAAELARVRSGQLLSDGERAELQAAITDYDKVSAECDQRTADALQASAILSVTEYDEPEHHEAAEEFRTAFDQRSDAVRRREKCQEPAERARRSLAEDRVLRAEYEPVVADGERAADALVELLRNRITSAVGRGAMLPLWFTTSLGPTAPAADTDAWIRTATQVLAYRVTYRVTDALMPLGVTPGSTAPAHRGEWHTELSAALAALH